MMKIQCRYDNPRKRLSLGFGVGFGDVVVEPEVLDVEDEVLVLHGSKFANC